MTRTPAHLLQEVRHEVQRLKKARALPALIFSRSMIRKNLEMLRELGRKHDCSFAMAVKSFPSPAILKLACSHLDGVEVSNGTEWELIRSSGHVPRTAWLNDPALDHRAIVALRSHAGPHFPQDRNDLNVSCETLAQAMILRKEFPRARVAFRLNSSEWLRGPARKNQRDTSRFGARAGEIQKIEKFLAKNPLGSDFGGFSFHHGGIENRAELYLMLALRLRNWVRKTGIPLPSINLGGGLAHLKWAEIDQMLANLRTIVPRQTRLWFEPGRLLTRGAGFAAGTIIDRRRNGAETHVVTDLSSICHLRWSFPQDISGRAPKNAWVAGPTCYEGDRLGKFHVPLRGDTLLVGNVSGYSVAWNRGFNGIPEAKVVILK